MKKLQILKYYIGDDKDIDKLEFEFDFVGERPTWIHIENPPNARFIAIRTAKSSGEIYKRFPGDYYLPIDYTPEEEKRFYTKYAKIYDQYITGNNLPMAQFILEKMIEAGIPKEARILDVGAGTGLFSDFASKAGFVNLALLDVSETMLAVAKTKSSLRRAQFISGNVTNVKLKELYDVFVSIMCFDSFSDQSLSRALANLTNYLKKGGYIFLFEDRHRDIYDKYFGGNLTILVQIQ